jgi:hypothetical protein
MQHDLHLPDGTRDRLRIPEVAPDNLDMVRDLRQVLWAACGEVVQDADRLATGNERVSDV